jgi:O-antigen/teichoic acid export membrane protein
MLLPLIAEGMLMIAGEGSTSGYAEFLRAFVRGDYKQEVINISLSIVVLSIILSVIISMLMPVKKEVLPVEDSPE